jgi:phosphoglucosamine mutase
MRRLFGTDGIRGVAGVPPLDRETLWRIGLALAETGSRNGVKPRIVMGRDTRISGKWISELLEAAMVSSGIDMISQVGVISTPGLAYLTRLHQCELGVMISASHNPYEDNGIKIFGRDGFKLSDEQELVVERLIDGLADRPLAAEMQTNEKFESSGGQLRGDYFSFLNSQLQGTLTPLRIGLDVCNGSAYEIAPKVFRTLGAKVSVVNDQPDGRNINLNCGSLYLSAICQLVEDQQLDLGVAFDGDADRALFVTSSGRIFDGDFVLYVLALQFQQRRPFTKQKVVGTIMSNYALEQVLKSRNIEFLRASVGDRYVLELMKQVGANLGGEPSGHVILTDYHTAGDGILTALKIAEILSTQKVSLDELADGFRPYPQVLESLRVRNKIPLDSSPEIARLVRITEAKLKGSGRLVVRYSGTEPLLRIMAEGEDADQVRLVVSRLKSDLASLFSAMS